MLTAHAYYTRATKLGAHPLRRDGCFSNDGVQFLRELCHNVCQTRASAREWGAQKKMLGGSYTPLDLWTDTSVMIFD